MIWSLMKTNETNHFKVKTWRGFDLTIFKVNKIHYKRIEIFTKDLTLNLLLPHVVIYWHDYEQAPNLQTPSLLGFTPTQATLLVTLRSHSKVSDYLYLLIFVVATFTTLDLKFLEKILPVEDFREVWVQKP